MKTEELKGINLNITNRIIAKELQRRNIGFQQLPKERFKIYSKEREYIVRRGKIINVLNSRLASRIVSMKEVTSRYLLSRGFYAPENVVFNKGEVERAWLWAKYILPVVLKPARGKQGQQVYVNISEYEEFEKCYKSIEKEYDDILIEKYVEGSEYRFTVINNEVVAISQRIPANVTGDGKNSIESLIHIKNKKRKKLLKHKPIKKDEETIRVLERQGYNLTDIPKKDEVVYLRNNSNVSTGGDAIDVTDKIDYEIKEYVRKAVRNIRGLRVCGVDVLLNDGEEPCILEINTEPMLLMHVYPWEGQSRDVIGKLVDAMFPETIEN